MLSQKILDVISSSSAYLNAVDHFCIQPDDLTPQMFRANLATVLLTIVQLYSACLSQLLQAGQLDSYLHVGNDKSGSPLIEFRPDEATIRQLLNAKFTVSGLKFLDLDDEFLAYFRVETSDDLISCLGLHLAEVYGEAYKITRRNRQLLVHSSEEPRGELHFQLLHIARNHIPFVLYPLEWSCNVDNWKTSRFVYGD